MNKTIIIIALATMLMIGVLTPLIFAENANASDATPNLISANPASTISDAEANINVSEDVKGFPLFWKQLGLAFTFNQEKKAQIEIELAKIQLIKAKIAEMNNNSDAMQKALDAHEKLINDVETRMDNLRNDSKIAHNLTGLNRAIEVHDAQIAKLNDLLANTNLTADQIDKLQNRLAHVENVTSRLTGVQSRIEAKLATLKNEADAQNITVAQLLRQRRGE